jgi:outer membrane lipoprotein SlyB
MNGALPGYRMNSVQRWPWLAIALLIWTTVWLDSWHAGAQPAPPPPPVPSDAQQPASVLAPSGAKPAVGTTDCDRCGKVEAIRQATASSTQWTPLGSTPSVGAGGSDLNPSAVTQYKIGKDLSNQGQVTIGAAGGAVYQTRPTQRNLTRWEIVVRMDDGSGRTVVQNYEPLLQVGDRVRVFGTQIELVQ